MTRTDSCKVEPDLLVIGYGNELRGDDAVGVRVAEAVEKLNIPGVRVLTCQQLTLDLADAVAQSRATIFVDASVRQPHAAVEVRPLTPLRSPSPLDHTMPPDALLGLCEAAFQRRPVSFLVRVGIADCSLGSNLTAKAQRGVAAALESVLNLLRTL